MTDSSKVFQIKKFQTLPSTNRYVLDNIRQLNDRDVIIADSQSAGRGRLNRNWKSDIRGNIYLTLCL
ncbi:MAG: hypothetical protein MJB14_05230, partial [Spirochaetes bacterium]|nr:hypothetical protein [Spirochaetota bacterium]